MKTFITLLFLFVSSLTFSQEVKLDKRNMNEIELNILHLAKKYHSFIPLSSSVQVLYIDSNNGKYVIEKQFFDIKNGSVKSSFKFDNENAILFSYVDDTTEYKGFVNVINNDVYTIIDYVKGSLSTVKVFKNGVLLK